VTAKLCVLPKSSAVIDRRYSRHSAAATIASAIVVILFIVSCASFAPPPEISPTLIANARPDHADANVLATGRKLFVSRCLECHTLPSVTKHSRDEWPHFVSRMSGRANLSGSEQNAIVAYLRAASLTGITRP
jgi:cytochrome c5